MPNRSPAHTLLRPEGKQLVVSGEIIMFLDLKISAVRFVHQGINWRMYLHDAIHEAIGCLRFVPLSEMSPTQEWAGDSFDGLRP